MNPIDWKTLAGSLSGGDQVAGCRSGTRCSAAVCPLRHPGWASGEVEDAGRSKPQTSVLCQPREREVLATGPYLLELGLRGFVARR
ncbi:MAG: hypothetical protein QOF87_4008 [Pseudonocardiales bacterium]|nr:hypothetical protein [Pseudonocardiales bacterium]